METPILTRQTLRDAIDVLPRKLLASIPTPIQDAPNLTKALGGPRILIKRDDLTGLGFGGNKVRHMEFCIADALEKGAHVSINANLPMSNNSRIICAASKKAGMDFVCVVPGGKNNAIQGNLLLLKLMGAELHLLDSIKEVKATNDESTRKYITDLAKRVRQAGQIPYVHSFEPMSRASGAIGYLDATLEIQEQLDQLGINDVTIYLASGASHGGLAMGAKALGLPWQVTGVLIAHPSEYIADTIGWANTAAEYLNLNMELRQGDVIQDPDYVGQGYAIMTTQGIEAMQLMAQLEGLILDPIYTAKAAAAMIDHIRKGKLTSRDTALFVHTGGLPELFNYAHELEQII